MGRMEGGKCPVICKGFLSSFAGNRGKRENITF
ncbi:hypothetical protein CHY_0224 [Carboxydothermus hydrogenoformans Z-2901]|uniref:Uncharacterized protein n=1 Tax=Carboxydothermus hydrogenoformans (strain ATCC BAA-161 / DSM 6008 / Z-2901) TaxID=246194 RepID=Q3AFI8_CARHZ|nr:hypothetical protein CHY_0224 [Carboxydothermus hydrogenoformans Z-2901]